jgi:hypothetical protein
VVGLGGGREGRPRDGEERGEEESAQEEHPVVGGGGGEIWAGGGWSRVGGLRWPREPACLPARVGLSLARPRAAVPYERQFGAAVLWGGAWEMQYLLVFLWF